MLYLEELNHAMLMLAEEPRSMFIGQAVRYPGTGMYRTLEGVPSEKRVEVPVAEDMQMGMAIGMALNGELPITIYPRWNFLLLAASQLVLHLDKLPLYSDYRPKVIIRTAVASPDPLNPGPQHLGDFTEEFNTMLETVIVADLRHADEIMPQYQAALKRKCSTLLVEHV